MLEESTRYKWVKETGYACFLLDLAKRKFVFENAPLRKPAYSNAYKISLPKSENFQMKNPDIFFFFFFFFLFIFICLFLFFHISAQNRDFGYSLEPPRLGGSNEYPQSIFFSKNKKNNVYPCKPQFYCIKVGFNGVKII